jgi:DNA-binding NtrC family response regulator
MNATLPPVLVVDDEKNMRLSLQAMLGDEGYESRAVESAEEALVMLGREKFFMVLTDAHLTGMTGYELLGRMRTAHPEIPVLMITAYATPKLAVEAIKAGAIDYLSKPFEPEELLHAISRCAERFKLLKENARLRSQASQTIEVGQIIGESPRMAELRNLIKTVALSLGQGTRRRSRPRPEPAARRALRPHQLRRHPRAAPRKRTLRPREGRVHRRAQTETRTRGGSRRRHHLPR